MKLNKQIFGWMGVSALLLTTACSNNDNFNQSPEEVVSGEVYGSGNSIVTLTLNPATAIGTRADETHISDGSKAKKLYFQVYEVTETGGSKTYKTFVEKTDVNVNVFPYTIRLAVDEKQKYAIAVWAQNAATTAFNVTDLENITVDYTQVNNNNDLSDAFCVTKEFNGGDEKLSVTLHRPFAQLNVGTTGADYNEFVKGNIRPNKKITYSRMEVDGVCNQIDVLKDKISKTSGYDGKAEFDYALIPAFYEQTFTSEPDYTNAFSSTNGSRVEEFLVVKLNSDSETVASNWNHKEENTNDQISIDGNKFLGYKTTYPTMDGDNYLTEKFRYLSMCYVLVPNEATSNDDPYKDWPSSSDKEHDLYHSSTINEVRVYFAENFEATTPEGDAVDGDSQAEEEDTEDRAYMNGYRYLKVKNVPVHRNWRTNLLGGLWAPKEPGDDPKDPDDPSSVFANIKVLVNICPIYFDEYNGTYSSEETPNHWIENGQGQFPSGTEDDTLHKEPHDSGSTN